MADTLPSQDMAVAYVLKIEREWYGETPVIKSIMLNTEDHAETWRIQTNNNLWDVWQRPDGRVYGEC